MILDLQERIVEELESKLKLPSKIDNPTVQGVEGISLRGMPVGPATYDYGGNISRSYGISIVAIFKDAYVADSALMVISDYLDHISYGELIQSANGSYVMSNLFIKQASHFAGANPETQTYQYAVSFECELDLPNTKNREEE